MDMMQPYLHNPSIMDTCRPAGGAAGGVVRVLTLRIQGYGSVKYTTMINELSILQL